MKRFLLLALLAAAPSVAPAQMYLPPVDRCASDRSFVTFRNELRSAIARRDAAFILAHVSDTVVYPNSFNGSRAGFARYWGLDQPERSRLWRELAAVLRLGCARDEVGQLWVPAANLPQADGTDAMSFREMAVPIVPRLPLRGAPSDTSRILARLRWDALTTPEHDDGRGAWVRVRDAHDREGWVRRSQIRQLTDYAAVFEKRRGRWLLTSFIQGD